MRQDKEYQKILDGAFSQHFPAWSEMSPYDPVKLFAEGVASSLGSVEKRQRRIVDTILDSLPALFSVKRKPMQLPVGLFQLTASPKLDQALNLPMDFKMRFQNSTETISIFPKVESRLTPASEFSETKDGDLRVLSFLHQGPSTQLVFQYFPQVTSKPVRLLNFECRVLSPGKEETLSSTQLKIENDTEGFSRFGNIRVQRLDKAPLIANTAEIKIKMLFEHDVSGNFFVNLFPFSFGLELENVDIGHLKGEPWEELSLPETLLDCPETVVLHYPNGTQQKLSLLEDNILYSRENNPDRFHNSFFYHGTHHSIVIPDADLLMHEFNGAVAVQIPKGILAPDSDWPFDGITEEYQPIIGEHAVILDDASAYRPYLSLIEREHAKNYLARFYSQWRQFPQGLTSETRPRDLFIEKLEQTILTNEPSLRAVEVKCDQEKRNLTAYCLAENPETQGIRENALAIPQEQAEKLRQQLSQLVPLSYGYRVAPFYSSPLKVNFVLALEVAESRLKLLSEEVLHVALRKASEKLLLPTPFGKTPAEQSIEKKEFLEEIKRILETDLLEANELRALEGTITNEAGAFLNQIVRQAGECFVADVRVKASFTSFLVRSRLGNGVLHD